MEFLEKDLEQIIYDADYEALNNRGLQIFGKKKRQLKIGNYGICDIIYMSKPYFDKNRNMHYKGTISILELKKDKIGVSTLFQALNYLKGVISYLEKRKLSNEFNYKIILIGREIDLNSSFVYLNDLFPDNDYNTTFDISVTSINLYKYSYSIDGLEFNPIYNYKLIEEGF